jgi:hypothetical protein
MLNSHVPENERIQFSGTPAWLAGGVFAFGDIFQNENSLVVLDFQEGAAQGRALRPTCRQSVPLRWDYRDTPI